MTQTWPTDVRRKSTQVVVGATVALLIAGTLQLLVGTSGIRSRMYAVPVVYRPPFTPAIDPILAAEEGIPPSTLTGNQSPDPSIKTILVYQSGITLYRGGELVKVIARQQSRYGFTLPEIAALVGDPSFISASGSKVTVNAALITLDATRLVIAAPATTEVVMENHPGVFIGATDGSITVHGAVVKSTSTSAGTPHAPTYRPFVVVMSGVVATFDHATFENLGWDWLNSYGVSLIGTVRGGISHSTFNHNFIGLYTQRLQSFTIANSTFDHNALYGIDPHTGSFNLTISGNTAEYNAAHGIILSKGVTASTVIHNFSARNGENGIMVDEQSNDNVVSHNTTEANIGDGVVVSNSTGVMIADNTIKANRVGVNVYANGIARVVHNTIADNVLPAIHTTINSSINSVDGPHDTERVPLPGWHLYVDVTAWSISLLLYLSTYLIRRRERALFSTYRLNPAQERIA
jgi:hypothetical protein